MKNKIMNLLLIIFGYLIDLGFLYYGMFLNSNWFIITIGFCFFVAITTHLIWYLETDSIEGEE